MAPIDWPRLSEKQYEDIVSMLLNHLHPTSTRVNGRGGDGGRDVQVVTLEGMHAFELKSFSGRMTPGRHQQVKRSLQRATLLDPLDWTLIVPIDPTPGDITWFDGLRRLVPFPIDQRGLTWLNAQLAGRPFIARYFLEDVANEIVRLAELLNQEKAVLSGGAPEALERAGAIVNQLNDLDPYYRFELTVGDRVRSVSLIPRYKGAETDRPIQGTFKFRFPNDEAGQTAAEAFGRALDFGTGASVPAEYVDELTFDLPGQLGGTYEKASLQIEPSKPESTTRTFILACESTAGSQVVELALDFELINHGQVGAVWRACDRTGAGNIGKCRTFSVQSSSPCTRADAAMQ